MHIKHTGWLGIKHQLTYLLMHIKGVHVALYVESPCLLFTLSEPENLHLFIHIEWASPCGLIYWESLSFYSQWANPCGLIYWESLSFYSPWASPCLFRIRYQESWPFYAILFLVRLLVVSDNHLSLGLCFFCVLVTLSRYLSPCLGTCSHVWVPVTLSGYLAPCLNTSHFVWVPVPLSGCLLPCLGTSTCLHVWVLVILSGYLV